MIKPYLEEGVEHSICKAQIQSREEKRWILQVHFPRLDKRVPKQGPYFQVFLLHLRLAHQIIITRLCSPPLRLVEQNCRAARLRQAAQQREVKRPTDDKQLPAAEAPAQILHCVSGDGWSERWSNGCHHCPHGDSERKMRHRPYVA